MAGQTTIFTFEARDKNLGALIEANRERLRRLNAEFKKVDEGTQEYKDLAVQIAATKEETRKLTDEQKKLNREFAAMDVPTDSLAGLRIEYAKLNDQIAKLSAAERNSQFGKKMIADSAAVKKQIDSVEQSLGRFTGNVGNYRSAFLSITQVISGGLIGGGLAVTINEISQVLSKGIAAVSDYGAALDRLSSITGVTGTALTDLEQRAKDLTTIDVNGQKIVNTAQDIFEAFTLVGSARPELLKDAEGLQEVTKQAIILSKASGENLITSVEAITTTLGQFNERAKASGRIINELAAGSKEGASEIKDTTEALKKFGTTAAVSNVNTAESIALIETLADRQLKGEAAGVQLRNILAKLAGADILPRKALKELEQAGVSLDVLKDKTLPLSVRLQELGKLQGNTAALTKAFGLENLSAAQILTQGVPRYNALLKSIQGTDEAYKQAAINADNLKNRMANLQKNGVNALTNTFLLLEPALENAVNGFNFIVTAIGDFMEIPLSDTLREQQAEFNALIGVLRNTTIEENQRTAVIKTLKNEYPQYLKFVNDDVNGQIDLAASLEEGNKQFEARILLQATEEQRTKLTREKLELESQLTKELIEQEKTKQAGRANDLAFQGKETTTTRADVSESNIEDLRERISSVDAELQKMLENANVTAQRTVGKTLEQLQVQYTDTGDVVKKVNRDIGGTAKENDAVAGSIRFLNEQVDELQKKIQNTPLDSPLLEKLVTDLDKAQKELKKAEQAFLQLQFKAKFGRELTAPDLTDGEQPTIEIIPELKVDADTKKDAKEKAAELKRETERGLEAIEFPIAVVLPDEEQRALDAFNEQRKKADEDYYANQQKLADEAAAKEEQRREQLKQAAINAASQIADATFAIQQNRVDREEQIAIQALENEYNRKIEKAGGNAKKVAALEKELAAKREAIEKESAKKRKKIAKTEAIIQGALSVVEALPDLVLAAFAAAATIAQIAVIDSQEFAEGGFPEEKKREQRKRLPRGVRLSAASNKLIAAFSQAPGGYAGAGIAPPDSTGRRPAGAYMKNGQMIVYHEGEYIAPASQVARHPEVFNFLETERKQVAKPFAKGGYSATAQPEYIAPASQVAKYPHLFGALNGEVAMSGYKERFPAMDRLVNRPEYGRASISFATGGFTTVPPPAEVKAERVVKVEAGLSEEQFRLLVETLSKSISTETGKEVRNGIALGLNDNNRQSERIAALGEQRTV